MRTLTVKFRWTDPLTGMTAFLLLYACNFIFMQPRNLSGLEVMVAFLALVAALGWTFYTAWAIVWRSIRHEDK